MIDTFPDRTGKTLASRPIPGKITDMKFIKREWLFLLIFALTIVLSQMDLSNLVDSGTTLTAPQKPDIPKVELNFTLVHALIVLALFLLGGFLIVCFLQRKNQVKMVQENAKWGFWDVLKVAVFYAFLVRSFHAYYLIWKMREPGLAYDKEVGAGISIVAAVATTLTVIWVVLGNYKQSSATLGISAKSFIKRIIEGTLGYFAFLPFLVGVYAVNVLIFYLAGESPQSQNIVKEFAMEQSNLLLVLYFTMAIVVAPITEEIFFRGYLYGYVRRRLGVGLALGLTGLIFSMLHGYVLAFLPLFVLGIWFAMLYERSKNIVVPITAHFWHNALTVLYIFFVVR